MLASGHDGSNLEEIALQEAEQLVRNMFILGQYTPVAKKNNINPHDIKKILHYVVLQINRKLISFTIVLIMKEDNGLRSVYISNAGMGMCYKLNSNEVLKLSGDEKDEIISEKLIKGDSFLLCSCEVAESLDHKHLQQALSLLKDPEEFCKRIIFSSYNKVGIGNFSAAVFVERNKSVWKLKKKNIGRIAIYSGILLLVAVLGILINNIAFKTPGQMDPKTIYPPLVTNSPPVTINQTPHEVLIPENPKKSIKDSKPAQVKKLNTTLNVDFMINGSVVMVTNWNTVEKDIRNISWEPNHKSKNRIHKYEDYTQIPGSIRVTFKDNSTRTYYIK